MFTSVIPSIITLWLITTPSFAAKYQTVQTLTDANLEKVRVLADAAVRSEILGNCGMVRSVEIISKKPSEQWINTLKQISYGSTTDSVDFAEDDIVDEVGAVEEAVEQAIGHVRAGRELDADAEKKVNKLKAAIEKFLEWNGNARLFTGGLEGEFSSSIAMVGLVDIDHNEILVFGDGYCE